MVLDTKCCKPNLAKINLTKTEICLFTLHLLKYRLSGKYEFEKIKERSDDQERSKDQEEDLTLGSGKTVPDFAESREDGGFLI